MKRVSKGKSWNKTAFPGIFYRETIDKTTGNVKDIYFTGWYSVGGKRFQCVFGSKAKNNWNPKKCADKMAEFRGNALEGKKPRDFREERELNEKIQDKEAAENEAKKAKEITISEFWDKKYYPNQEALIQQKHKKPKSVIREKSLYNHWIEPHLGDTPLINVDFNSLLDLKKKMLDKGLSVRSVEYALAVLRQIFNFATSTGDFQGNNPVTIHKKDLKIKVNNSRKQWFSVKEFQKIKEALKQKNIMAYTLAMLGFHTGGRLNELYQLTWDDVDFKKRFIYFRPDTTKNAKGRHVPINAELLSHLQTIHKDQNPDPSHTIIKDLSGNPIIDVTTNTLTNIFISVLEDTGLRYKKGEKMSFHHTRHSIASILAQSGKVTLHELKDLMGHQTLQMTMRYAHHFPKNKDMIEKLDVLSAKEPEPETTQLPENVIELKKA